ncbi:MAG: hypothetical protein LBP35_05080 [Candidatus Ancillula trichonymphae]|nr:hypothetical protein [Candidatus Ancillula trichonymphae]
MKNNLYTSFDSNWVVDIMPSSEIGGHALEGTYQATADENTGKRIVLALKNHGIVANYRYLGSSVYISEFFFILSNTGCSCYSTRCWLHCCSRLLLAVKSQLPWLPMVLAARRYFYER